MPHRKRMKIETPKPINDDNEMVMLNIVLSPLFIYIIIIINIKNKSSDIYHIYDMTNVIL